MTTMQQVELVLIKNVINFNKEAAVVTYEDLIIEGISLVRVNRDQVSSIE